MSTEYKVCLGFKSKKGIEIISQTAYFCNRPQAKEYSNRIKNSNVFYELNKIIKINNKKL